MTKWRKVGLSQTFNPILKHLTTWKISLFHAFVWLCCEKRQKQNCSYHINSKYNLNSPYWITKNNLIWKSFLICTEKSVYCLKMLSNFDIQIYCNQSIKTILKVSFSCVLRKLIFLSPILLHNDSTHEKEMKWKNTCKISFTWWTVSFWEHLHCRLSDKRLHRNTGILNNAKSIEEYQIYFLTLLKQLNKFNSYMVTYLLKTNLNLCIKVLWGKPD